MVHGIRREWNGPGRGQDILRLPDEGVHLEDLVEDIEKRMIRQALERTHGVKKRAAELLHVSFRSFRYRLEKYAMNEREQAAVGE